MRNKTEKRNTTLVIVTTLAIFFVLVVPGTCGYYIFGDSVKSVVLDSFSTEDVLISVVKIAFFVSISISFPHPLKKKKKD